jgi:hypothetical protein
VHWDLEKFWIGHANKDVAEKYAEQLKEDVEYRHQCERDRQRIQRLMLA